jgi:hypothetical protein
MDLAWTYVNKHRRVFLEAVLWLVGIQMLRWALDYFGEALIPQGLLRVFIVLLLSIPIGLVYIALKGGFIAMANDAVSGKSPSLKTGLGAGFHMLISLIWVISLVFISVIGGFILFIIPGLIFAVYLAFAHYAVMIDNVRGIEALKKSWRTVSGRFWQVLARLVIPNVFFAILTGIPSLIIILIIGLAFNNLPLLFSVNAITDLPMMQSFLITLVTSFFAACIAPLSVMNGVILWKELQEKSKEVTKQTA